MADLTRWSAWLNDYARAIREHKDELTDLDRRIGDADHGANLDRGMTAVAALDPAEFDDAGAYLKKAGMTLVSTVGGASGPLFGTFLLRFAGALAHQTDDVDARTLAGAFAAGLEGVRARGKAADGEKTMIDALAPAVEAMSRAAGAGEPVGESLAKALAAAEQGRDATIDLIATKGRASYLGERSRGTADPGATSITMLIASAAATLG